MLCEAAARWWPPPNAYSCSPPPRFNVRALPEPGYSNIFSRVLCVRLVNVTPVSRIGFTVHRVWCPSVYSEKCQVPTDDFLASGRWIECRACSAGAFDDVHGVVVRCGF